ncbi:MAG: cation diffusion facilitator family transporter [Acidobacteriota bacterium]
MGHSHSGAHGHSHSHSHSHGSTGKILIASLILTIAFVLIEVVAGFWSGSLALLSDAGHNFTDAFGLGLAAVAYRLESRPGDHIKTFGYQRTGVLAAFVNALLLVVVSVGLLWESYQHLLHPEPVQESIMLWVAALGIVINLLIAWSLIGHGHKHDLNVRAAFVHQVGDAASCVAIIIGALVIHYTGWMFVDPLLSIVIAVFIIWTSWDLFKDSLNILLEGLPKGLNLADVIQEVRCIAGVGDVHDLHIWSLGSEARALSCHVLIDDMPPSESDAILCAVNTVLADRFDIHHTTIQFEHKGCALTEVNCGGGRRPHQHAAD